MEFKNSENIETNSAEIGNLENIKDIPLGGKEIQRSNINEEFSDAERLLKSRIGEVNSEDSGKVMDKLGLTDQEKEAFSKIEGDTGEPVSFDKIVGYKKGACSGKEIPIYD